MKVKIDTKEKFHVLQIKEPVLSANMTEEIYKELLEFLQKEIKNIVLRMNDVNEMDEEIASLLITIQKKFYDSDASFVVCEMTSGVEQYLNKLELLSLMNTAPTESEAWDIVQLEEIERELMPPNTLKG